MKVRSMIRPEPIWIRAITDNQEAQVRLRENIALKAETEESIDHAYYEWDEVELSLVDRDNLLGYVQENFEALFAFGIEEEKRPKPKTAKELRDEQIKALQDQNTELVEMNLALYESNVKLQESTLETNEFLLDMYEMLLGGE